MTATPRRPGGSRFNAGTAQLGLGELILAEVLQGARSDAHANRLVQRLRVFDCIPIAGRDGAIAAA